MNWRFWEWGTLETRENSFTDELVEQIVARAGGTVAVSPSQSGALQAGAGLYGRAFASATINGARPAVARVLTPSVLEHIGRGLIRTGECLLYLRVTRDGLRLFPVVSHDVLGTYDPATWRYRLDLSGPSGTWSVNARPDSVVHCRYMTDPAQPWRGLAPLDVARSAGKLNAETNAALTDESSGPRGLLLPVPKDGGDESLNTLREQLASLGGKAALVETTAGGYGQGPANAPRADWKAQRLGMGAPDSLVNLRNDADRLILGLLGVPLGLLEKTDGAALRESWRQFLYASVQPLGRIVAGELRDKLDTPLTFEWSNLGASDISGRARAFNSLVAGGMELDKALAVTGLLAGDD